LYRPGTKALFPGFLLGMEIVLIYLEPCCALSGKIQEQGEAVEK